MKSRQLKLMAFLFMALSLPSIVFASHDTMFWIQGELFNSATMTPSSNVQMAVDIFTTNTCIGSPYWTGTFPSATDVNGVYSLLISNISMDFNQNYYACVYANATLVNGAIQFRAGQGQVTEEDVSFTDLNITDDLYVGDKLTVVGDIDPQNIYLSGNIYMDFMRELNWGSSYTLIYNNATNQFEFNDGVNIDGDLNITGIYFGDGSGLTNLNISGATVDTKYTPSYRYVSQNGNTSIEDGSILYPYTDLQTAINDFTAIYDDVFLIVDADYGTGTNISIPSGKSVSIFVERGGDDIQGTFSLNNIYLYNDSIFIGKSVDITGTFDESNVTTNGYVFLENGEWSGSITSGLTKITLEFHGTVMNDITYRYYTQTLGKQIAGIIVSKDGIGVSAFVSQGIVQMKNNTKFYFNYPTNSKYLQYNTTTTQFEFNDDVYATYFIGDGSQLTNITATAFNETDPIWTADKVNYLNTTEIANLYYNKTESDNKYYLNTNPSNFWNDTYATFNKTYADTLYAPTGYGDDWNKTYADTLYYNISNPNGYYNSTTLPNQTQYWNRTGTTVYPSTAGDNVNIDGTLNVTGLTNIFNSIYVDEDVIIQQDLFVGNNIIANGTGYVNSTEQICTAENGLCNQTFTNYWNRSGTILITATAGDDVSLKGDLYLNSTGKKLYLYDGLDKWIWMNNATGNIEIDPNGNEVYFMSNAISTGAFLSNQTGIGYLAKPDTAYIFDFPTNTKSLLWNSTLATFVFSDNLSAPNVNAFATATNTIGTFDQTILKGKNATIGNSTGNTTITPTGTTLYGTARVNKTIQSYAYNMYGLAGTYNGNGYSASAGATLGQTIFMNLLPTVTGGNVGSAFIFNFITPQDRVTDSNFTVIAHYQDGTTETCNIVMGIGERHSADGESYSQTDTWNQQTFAVPTTQYLKASQEFTFDGSGIENGNAVAITVYRNGEAGADTCGGSIYVSSLEIKYLSDKI